MTLQTGNSCTSLTYSLFVKVEIYSGATPRSHQSLYSREPLWLQREEILAERFAAVPVLRATAERG